MPIFSLTPDFTRNNDPYCNCFDCSTDNVDGVINKLPVRSHADLVIQPGDIIQAQAPLRMYWLNTPGKYKDFVKGTTLIDYPVLRFDKSFLYFL